MSDPPFPVSGLYQGQMLLPQPGRFELDVRIDIDPAVPNSVVTNRISGDLYQVTQTAVPGQPAQIAKTYIESWIIDQPEVTSAAGQIEVRGFVRYWTGTHPVTNAILIITWPGAPPVASAELTFTETGGTTRRFNCVRSSQLFRQVELEIGVCTSVNKPPLHPTYDTNWLGDRPAETPQRVLTIESVYREAGVDVTISAHQSVVDDAAHQFRNWTPALLHDAMETHYSQYGGVWPNWKMWGLMAGTFEQAGVGGLMFDASSQFGGAGKGTERQGFAVFREHPWFNDLIDGPPQNDAQATAARQFLYTWVHEAGHSYNFMHSWDKGRPEALSWMNYDWRYDQLDGAGNFWKRFPFRFDDDELIHLRHGNRSAVIMGGDPWASGSHLEAPNLAMTQIQGSAPLELIVRSKPYFEFMEPVLVELRLRNLLPHTIVPIDKRLPVEFGGVAIFIQNPDGHVVQYDPVMCAVGTPEILPLAPTGAEDGSDRYSRELFLSYGSSNFYFDKPGEYRIRAVYQGAGDVLIPSEMHRIRIGVPADKALDRKAQDYFTDSVGLALYLQGSRSEYLKNATDVLNDLADRYKTSAMGTKIATTLANGVAKPFFHLDSDSVLKQTARADPEEALKLTRPALDQFRKDPDKSNNLAYARLVLRRADYHRATDEAGSAHQELQRLTADLAKREANKAVIDKYRRMAGSPGPDAPPARGAPRTAKKAVKKAAKKAAKKAGPASRSRPRKR